MQVTRQIRHTFACVSCYCATFRLHFNHARRGRALAAISGKVPSVSGVCRQPFSLGPHLAGTLVPRDMRRTLRTRSRRKSNVPRNSAVAHQRGNHSNNKLSCHLVGILLRHTDGLYTLVLVHNSSLFCKSCSCLE